MKATALDLKRRSKQEWMMDRARGCGILIDPWDSKFTVDDLPRLLQPGTRVGEVPSNKGRRMPAEVYSPDEVALLISAWDPASNSGARNRAMVGLFYGAGLRLNEALSIRPNDIDIENGAIRVLFGKGQRTRTVGIDMTSLRLVAHWMEMHEELGFIPGTPLICSMYGNKLSKSCVYESLRRAARKVGLNRRVHPNGFRHSMAYSLAMDGVPLTIIRIQLGHVHISSTAAYIEHLAPIEVVRVIAARSW